MRVDNKQLPVDWTVSTIEDIADVNPRLNKAGISDDLNVSFVPMPAVGAADGSIDVSGERLFGEVKKGFTPFQEGDVLFAKITPCMENGKMAIVPKVENGLGFGSTEFHVLRPKEGIDARYIYYYVSSKNFRGEAERYMSGAVGQKRVTTPYLKESKIPVAPPEQQKRIVAEIEKQFSRLDEAVANLKRVKANLKRYKAAVLKAAVEGKLTEKWREEQAAKLEAQGSANAEGDTTSGAALETAEKLLKRILTERRQKWEEAELAKMKAKGKVPKDDQWKKKYKEPAGPDTVDLSELPKLWVTYKTDQLFCFVTSGSRGWAKYYSDEGAIFLRVGNLDHDSVELDLSNIQYVSPPDGAEGTRTQVQSNDILISITADVGMIAVVPHDFGEAYINQHISLARPVESIKATYLAWYLASRPGQRQFQELQRGATKAGLGLDDIRAVNIPLPPILEQVQIVTEIESKFSVVAAIEKEISRKLTHAERFRQSILSKAFSGGLSV